MTVKEYGSEGEQELLLVVERLCTQDKRRIVSLVELLSRAPANLRAASQRELQRVLSRECMTHGECIESIDSVLAGIEFALGSREALHSGQEFPQPAMGRVASG
jgi:hypothetical protein